MNTSSRRFVLVVFVAFSMQAALAEVRLNDATRKNLGVEVATLATASVPKRWPATAQVLDPAPLIAQLGEMHAAEVQAESSRNEAARLTRLYSADSNVSLKSLEAARAQSSADETKLQSVRAQWLTGYGRALANLTDAERERLTADLLSGRAALARIETLQSALNVVPSTVKVQPLIGDGSWHAQLLGPATLGSQSIGSAYLIKISAALQPGMLLTAELSDPKAMLQGIKVPRSAVIRWQGSDWIFLETEHNRFERVVLLPAAWLDDGCLVQRGLMVGSKVVSSGAALLLAAESRPTEE